MYAEERQHEIVTRARELGRVSVADLAARYDVTPETIRPDHASKSELPAWPIAIRAKVGAALLSALMETAKLQVIKGHPLGI